MLRPRQGRTQCAGSSHVKEVRIKDRESKYWGLKMGLPGHCHREGLFQLAEWISEEGLRTTLGLGGVRHVLGCMRQGHLLRMLPSVFFSPSSPEFLQ